MKFAVIGGGSVGLLFASYIAKKTNNIVIYTRSDEQAKQINYRGIMLKKHEKGIVNKVKATPLKNQIEGMDVIIVAVKQYDVENVIKFLQKINKDTIVIFVQNGMGHIHLLDKLKSCQIILGVVEHGTYRHSYYEVEHTGIGRVKFSSYTGTSRSIDDIIEIISSSDFLIENRDNWKDMLVEKLCANAIINPLTALYRVKNGKLLEKDFFTNMVQLFNEISLVLERHNDQATFQSVVSICEKTKENQSSMLKDILEQRQTEIDAILGYILQQGKQKNIELPLTQFLYNSIKGLEKGEVGECGKHYH